MGRDLMKELNLYRRVGFSRDCEGFEAAERFEARCRAEGLDVRFEHDAVHTYVVEDDASWERRARADLLGEEA